MLLIPLNPSHGKYGDDNSKLQASFHKNVSYQPVKHSINRAFYKKIYPTSSGFDALKATYWYLSKYGKLIDLPDGTGSMILSLDTSPKHPLA